jgi:hypothetical protein
VFISQFSSLSNTLDQLRRPLSPARGKGPLMWAARKAHGGTMYDSYGVTTNPVGLCKAVGIVNAGPTMPCV